MKTGADRGAEARLVARCRKAGVPVTAQRRAVLRALAARRDHPTAEQVHAAAAARAPGMTRATVYRVLEALERLEVVRRVERGGGAARFEVATGPHHHLVCVSCGRIDDLRDPAPAGPPPAAARAAVFLVREILIQFRGLCRSCRGRESAGERKRR